MIQYYKASLAIEAQALIAHGIISRSAYDKMAERQDLRIVRRGCRNTCALVDYESMPDRIKQAVVAAFGNPYDYVADNALLHHLQPNPAAAEWLEAYRPDGVRHLRTQAVCRYHAEACILDAIGRLLASRRSRSSALGHRSARLWDELARLVTLVDTLRWPHSLPRNPRSLERKYKAYMQDGCAALVHKGYANNNAARITDDTDIRALLALVSDPRNLSDAAVVRLYNAARPDRPVTPRVVARFRAEHEQEIYARRHGATRFRAERLMTVRRSAPTAPLRLWTLDGWDAELLYQRTVTDKRGHTVTTYHNRVKLEVVLDTCTRYPVGFAIADTESPELVRAALRNAINHCATLFGRRYRPQQLQMDRAGYQTLLSTYRQTALRVTPAAVRNAKAKVIEPWFRYFNDTYCHLQTNWSGYGLTARADAQPNTEFINRHRHSFPDRDGVIEQLTRFIEMERARLHDEFISRWQNQSTDVELCPMTDEQYLTAFGIHSEHTYLMRNTGIRFTLAGWSSSTASTTSSAGMPPNDGPSSTTPTTPATHSQSTPTARSDSASNASTSSPWHSANDATATPKLCSACATSTEPKSSASPTRSPASTPHRRSRSTAHPTRPPSAPTSRRSPSSASSTPTVSTRPAATPPDCRCSRPTSPPKSATCRNSIERLLMTN